MASNSTIAQAYVKIIPTTKDIKTNIAKELSPQMDKESGVVGKAFGGNLVKTIGKVLAAAGIGKIIGDAISAGADLQQSVGGIETLFKDSANTMIDYANEAYRTVGMSANNYMENVTGFSASLLQGLGGDTQKAAEVANMAMIDMGDNANKMGSSMESIQNAYQGFAKQNYTMLDNLKLGYGGTKTEMERLLADAEKLTGVEYNIDNLSDVYEAIHVIQEELEITGTTALEASETFTGASSAMKASWENFLGALTTGGDVTGTIHALMDSFETLASNAITLLSPLISAIPTIVAEFARWLPDLVDLVSKTVIDIVDAFAKGMPKVIPAITDGLLGALDSFIINIPGFIQAGADLIQGILDGIISAIPILIDYIPIILQSIITAIMDSLPILMDAITNVVMAIVDALPQIIQSLIDILPTVINMLIDTFMTLITETLPTLLEAGMTLLMAIADGIMESLPLIIEAGIELMKALIQGIVDNISMIIETATTIIDTLITFLVENLPLILEMGIEILMALIDGIIDNLDMVIESMITLITQLIETLTENLPKILEAGMEILMALVDGIIDNLPEIVSAVWTIITTIVKAIWENLPEILKAGWDLLVELAKGIWQALGNLNDTIEKIVMSIVEWVKEVDWLEVGANLLKAIAKGITNTISWIVDKIKTVTKRITTVFSNIKWSDLGRDLVRGIWNGISNMANWLWDKISGWAGNLFGKVKGFFGIESPSTLFRDEIGEMIPAGMAVGIEDNLGVIDKAMAEMEDHASGDFEANLNVGTQFNHGMLDRLQPEPEINKRPANITFAMAQHEFKAYVDDISSIQDQVVGLKLAYS